MKTAKHKKILVFRKVTYEYKEWFGATPTFDLKNVSFTLKRGRTLGLLGPNGSGKTTVAKIIMHGGEYGKTRENKSKALWPTKGAIFYQGRNFIKRRKRPAWVYVIAVLAFGQFLALFFGAIILAAQAATAMKLRPGSSFSTMFLRTLSVMLQLSVDDAQNAVLAMLSAMVFGFVLLLIEHCCRACSYNRFLRKTLWADIGFISSELLCSGEPKRVDPEMTVEKAITLCMPDSMSKHAKRMLAIELLTRCHFSMYKDGEPVGSIPDYFKQKLTVGKLSGGQTHLIHILQVMCSRPKILVCDELLGGLDQRTQIAVLKLIRERQRDTGMSILFISTEMGPMQVMAHEVAFMVDGAVVAQGTPDQVFQSRDSRVQKYVTASRSIFKSGDPATHFRNKGVGVRC